MSEKPTPQSPARDGVATPQSPVLRRRRDAQGFPVVEPLPKKREDEERIDAPSRPMERFG